MEIGWIDFSKTERDKVLSIFELLDDPAALDELGIAPIRDAYSDLFFPGTSTVQTRAKYFFIVPYVLQMLESNNQTDYINLVNELDNIEEKIARTLIDKNPDERGIIGKNALLKKGWVQRAPSSIYWSGLKRYGIIKYNLSISDYIKQIVSQKLDKKNNKLLQGKTERIEGISDDKFALKDNGLDLLYIIDPDEKWMENLEIKLTYEEGQFLKDQIISSCEGSMFAYILNEKELFSEVLNCDSFSDLEGFKDKFPKEMQKDYSNALSFSKFVFALRVIYNVIVSDGKNEIANNLLDSFDLKEISKIDIDDIMFSFDIENYQLKNFLTISKQLMEENNLEGLKSHIKSREIYLKGINRSKTVHAGEFDLDKWFGGDMLDYRFYIAKNIMKDIYESENISSEVIEDVES